jgi:drug/metabolite transporter (DMT)-like permease
MSSGRGGGVALAVAAVVLFSLNAGVCVLVLRAGVSPELLATLRALGGAAVIGTLVIVTGRAGTLRRTPGELPWILLHGAAGVALVQWAYFVAIDRLPLGLALLLEYTAPVLVALVSRFVLARPVSALAWPALALTVGGLVLATRTGAGEGLDPIGVAAGLTAALAYAVFYLVGERLVARRDGVSTTFWGLAVAAVVSVALTLIVPGAGTGLPAIGTGSAVPGVILPLLAGDLIVPVWLLLAWVVVLGTVAPFAMVTAALRMLPATIAAIIGTAEVVGSALVGWWWFGQSFGPVQLIGFALVLSGVVLALAARGGAGMLKEQPLPGRVGP